MDNENYQREYKKLYNSKNKIVTFPLSNAFYEELKNRAVITDVKTNSYAKYIVTEYLNNNTYKVLTEEQTKYIKEYIHISRGIATNINQIAYNSNIGKQIDVSILIDALKTYEEEFKKFIQKA